MPYKETLIFEETSIENCKYKISNQPINRKIDDDEHISVSKKKILKKNALSVVLGIKILMLIY